MSFLTKFPSLADHNHLPRDEGEIKLEEMIMEMEELVRQNPREPVADAKLSVMEKHEKEYGGTDTWSEIISEIGTKSQEMIERRLRRVRKTVIGKMPKTRDR